MTCKLETPMLIPVEKSETDPELLVRSLIGTVQVINAMVNSALSSKADAVFCLSFIRHLSSNCDNCSDNSACASWKGTLQLMTAILDEVVANHEEKGLVKDSVAIQMKN